MPNKQEAKLIEHNALVAEMNKWKDIKKVGGVKRIEVDDDRVFPALPDDAWPNNKEEQPNMPYIPVGKNVQNWIEAMEKELAEKHEEERFRRGMIGNPMGEIPIYNPIKEEINYVFGIDPIRLDGDYEEVDLDDRPLRKKPSRKAPIDKEREEEANLIRIDLEKAAHLLTEEAWKDFPGMKLDKESDSYLEVYDKYYNILYKSKA